MRFRQSPSPAVRKKIIASAPAALRLDARSFVGRMVALRGSLDADVEKWLLEVHERCAIELVHRAADPQGTFSAWHRESLTSIRPLLKTWGTDKTIANLPTDELHLVGGCVQAMVASGKVNPKDIPVALRALFPYQLLRAYFSIDDQRGADQLIASLSDSVRALDAIAFHTYDERKTKSVKERAKFLHFIRTLVDARSIASAQHALLIFHILWASMLLGDQRFGTKFAKLLRASGNRRARDSFVGYCHAIRAGNDRNLPNPALAKELSKLLGVPPGVDLGTPI